MPTYPTYKLSEIARSTKGKKPKSVSKEKTDGFEIPYVDIKAFEKGIVDNYTDGENCTFCKPDDVLIVWDGARCGFVGRGVEGAIGSTLAKISSEKYTNDFLFYFLQSKYKVLNSNPRGVGIPHIEPNLLWNFEIPNVDKTTQLAIVSRIEDLFAELDKAVQHLRTAQQQLKTYRQAVLNHWLNNEDGKWEMVKLGEVAEMCLGKMLDKNKNKGTYQPYLRNVNVRWGGFDLDDLLEMKFEESEQDRYGIRKGDLIMCEGGEPGRCAIWNSDIPNMKIQKALHRIRLNDNVLNKYMYFLFVLYAQNGVLGKYFTGTTIKHLTGQSLKSVEFSLPPLAEQRRIVAEIESRLSQASTSSAYIENALQQSEALRQSILKKAFGGELVVSTSSTTSKGG